MNTAETIKKFGNNFNLDEPETAAFSGPIESLKNLNVSISIVKQPVYMHRKRTKGTP
jgi:hypothetical protein